MAKKKKKSRGTSLAAKHAAGDAHAQAKKKLSRNQMIYLILATLAAFIVLESVLSLEASLGWSFSIIMPVYYIFTAVLLIVILFLNKGFSKGELTPDMLKDSIPPEEAARICDTVNRQKKLAKKLMLVLFPFLFSVLLDVIYLFYGDMFTGFLSLFA